MGRRPVPCLPARARQSTRIRETRQPIVRRPRIQGRAAARLRESLSARASTAIVRRDTACTKKIGVNGYPRSAADLQPRQFRFGASAPLSGDRSPSGRAVPASVGPDPLGLADHRQLRFQVPRRFRARARRDQAAQRRIHAPAAAHRHRADARHPQLHHPAHRRHLRPAPLSGRQGAFGPARRGPGHPDAPEGAGHTAGAGPARRDGRAEQPARRMAAQERLSGPARPL